MPVITNKLYRITIQATGELGVSYVVAKDPSEAYSIIREYLDENNLLFHKERELSSIQLIAESNQFVDCGCHLFLSQKI